MIIKITEIILAAGMGLGDFGAIVRGTENPAPTAARLCAKIPSFQFGTCDRQGSHGQCSRLGVSHGQSLSEKFPSPMPRRVSDDTNHKQTKNALDVENDIQGVNFFTYRYQSIRCRLSQRCGSTDRSTLAQRQTSLKLSPSTIHLRCVNQFVK